MLDWFKFNLKLTPLSSFLPRLVSKDEVEESDPPSDESLVQLKFPEYVRITLYDPGEGWEDDDDDEDDDDEDGSMEEADCDEKDQDSEKKSKKSQKEKKDSKSKEEKKSQKSKSKSDLKEEKIDEDEEVDESFGKSKPCIVLYHSLNNKIESDDEDGEESGDDEEDIEKESKKVKFPLHYRDALLILHRTAAPIAVCDLPLTSKDRLELVTTLWCEGFLKEVAKS